MKRIAILAILAIPVPAHAFYLSCGRAASLILNGDQQQQGVAVGHSTGVVDMITAAGCYVGRPNCRCLDRLLIDNVRAFSEAIGEEIASCAVRSPNDSAVGPALRAAARICGN